MSTAGEKELGYPRVKLDVKKLRHNIDEMTALCGRQGISVTGVIKGFNGIPAGIRQFDESGCAHIASSRLEQLAAAAEMGALKPLMLIRAPMKSEISEVVRLADISLNSEVSILKELDSEAGRQGKIHKVILMVDLGDLREGFWDKDELTAAAVLIEKELENLHLLGIGTTLGCYGAISSTPENMNELIGYAETIEAIIGRELEMISGGTTKALPLLLSGKMPKRINNLRIGEAIILAQELQELYGCDMSFMHQDAFMLEAEVIEIKDKPTYPVGEQAYDAFGQEGKFEDRGIRRRALAAAGKLDFVFPEMLIPEDTGISIVGASSDHLILDTEDCSRSLAPGDVVSFKFCYATLVYATNSANMKIAIK